MPKRKKPAASASAASASAASSSSAAAADAKPPSFLSGYRFVYKAGKKWQVRVKHKKACFYMGVFGSAEEAARAADWKVVEQKWPSELRNFPKEKPLAQPPKRVAVGRIHTRPQPVTNRSGFRGVHLKRGGCYMVQCFIHSKCYTDSGPYKSPDEAARAYDQMAVVLGRSANYLNFPDTYDAVVQATGSKTVEKSLLQNGGTWVCTQHAKKKRQRVSKSKSSAAKGKGKGTPSGAKKKQRPVQNTDPKLVTQTKSITV